MDAESARIVADGLLKGAFDVFDAMLSKTFKYELQPPQDLTETVLDDLLGRFPVALHGTIKNDLGGAALLFSVEDASTIAALILETGSGPKSALDNDDRSVLKEVAEPALGGGVTNLMERFGHAVEQMAAVVVDDRGAGALDGVLATLGEAPGSALFQFSAAPDMSGEAAVLFSGSLVNMVPKKSPAPSPAAAALSAEATLSPEEMSDILSGFGPEPPDASAMTAPTETYHNLDMVLDIRLRATARLGRVELPISDILNFGPGSIIEVGHLVDEPIELLINDKLVARGDVVVIDEKFGLRITEIVSTRERIESLR